MTLSVELFSTRVQLLLTAVVSSWVSTQVASVNDESAADNAVPTGVGKSHESAQKAVSFP